MMAILNSVKWYCIGVLICNSLMTSDAEHSFKSLAHFLIGLLVFLVWSCTSSLYILEIAIPLLGLYPKNPETPIQKNLCTPMFIAAQFTIAKGWKQPKCPSANEWIKKTVVHLHDGILPSRKKERAPTLCHIMDGTGEHYAK